MHKKIGINRASTRLPSTRPIRAPPLRSALSLLWALVLVEGQSSPNLWLVADPEDAETICEPFHR